MAKKYTAQEIMDMAAGLITEDSAADLDLDGAVTSDDARYALRQSSGMKPLDTNALMAENVLNKIINTTGSFSYSPDTDELYSLYKKLYDTEGTRAAENVLGLASSLTGGYANSYGITLAKNQKDAYTDRLLEKGEELEERAYSRYLDSLDSLYSLHSLLTDTEKSDTEKKNAALQYALSAYSVGDRSFLEALGITADDSREFDALSDKADFFAKYGDYSLLEELGVDLKTLNHDDLMELGEYFAKYGDYSILNSLGVNTDNRELEEYYDRLIKKYKV